MRSRFTRLLRSELALRIVARLAFVTQIAARKNDAAEYVVGELDTTHVESFLDAKQTPVDECRKGIACRADGGKRLLHALLGETFAIARFGEELIFDDATNAGRLIGQRALVEFREDRVTRSGQQSRRDFGIAARNAHQVELAADKTQQRRLDLGVDEFRAARDETHDRFGNFLRYEPTARLQHRTQRLRSVHAREPHPILRDRRHDAFHAFQMSEVVLAQRDQDAIVRTREVEIFGRLVIVLDPRFECGRRAILDEIGKVLEKSLRAQPAGIVGLCEREDLLELIEDQQRQQRVAFLIAQQIAAMVQEFP